jgi:hypothetical protein
LYVNGGDLGGETPEKRFVIRAGSVHDERDTPCSIDARGALELEIDAPIL